MSLVKSTGLSNINCSLMEEIREAEVEIVMLNQRLPLMWFHQISSGTPARTGDPPTTPPSPSNKTNDL